MTGIKWAPPPGDNRVVMEMVMGMVMRMEGW